MKIDAFKSRHTIDDIRDMLYIQEGNAKEFNEGEGLLPPKSMFNVTGTEFNDMRYAMSSSKNGMIGKNFFTFAGEDAFRGLAFANQCSVNVTELMPPIYSSFYMAHQECWLGQKQDTTWDLYCYGKLVKQDILDKDILMLGNKLGFLQVDTTNERSLVCLNLGDLSRGVFLPQSQSDFEEWYDKNVCRMGYSGELDDCRVSDLFRVYYEVLSCIFSNGNFMPITV